MRVPSWYWSWVRWRLGEGEFKRFGPKRGPRPANAPKRIPRWAWTKLVTFLARRKPKPSVVQPEHPSLAFWRRMGVWVTRIDHAPPIWIERYGKGQYGIVVVPTLRGMFYEVDRAQLRAYVSELHALGFDVVGSQWGEARDPVGEAMMAVAAIRNVGLDGWIMNGEKLYEGGGLSADYVEAFRRHLPNFPLGWSPEPQLALDHGVLQKHGVAYMPQAYPLENLWGIPGVVDVGHRFGYETKNIVPLVQAYPDSDGRRFQASIYRDQARGLGLPGLILYTANQTFDVPEYWRDLVL